MYIIIIRYRYTHKEKMVFFYFLLRSRTRVCSLYITCYNIHCTYNTTTALARAPPVTVRSPVYYNIRYKNNI